MLTKTTIKSVITKPPSLFSLQQPDAEQQISLQDIHTVNLFSPKEENLAQIKGLTEYFSQKTGFLKFAFEFAKWWRVNHNEKFNDDLGTKQAITDFLDKNKETYRDVEPIQSTEFGVITNKIVESIKSIEQNLYLKEFQKNLKAQFALVNHPSLQSQKKLTKEQKKERETIIKNHNLTVSDIESITPSQLLLALNYSIFNVSQNIIALCDLFLQEDDFSKLINPETVQTLKETLQNLISELESAIDSALKTARETIHLSNSTSKDKLLEAFSLAFYFPFDDNARTIEDLYVPDINSNVNNLRQDFITNSLDTYPDLHESNRKNIQRLWFFNWDKENVVERFAKGFKEIITSNDNKIPQDIEDKLFLESDTKTLYLTHPAKAPRFPSKGLRMLSWDIDKRSSEILKNYQQHFTPFLFFDYLFTRSKKIIESHNDYRFFTFTRPDNDQIHQKNNDNISSERPLWLEWLERIIKGVPVIDTDTTFNSLYPDSHQHKVTSTLKYIEKKGFNNLKEKTHTLYSFQCSYSDGNINKRIEKISQLVRSTPKDLNSFEVLGNYFNTIHNNIFKESSELYLLHQLHEVHKIDVLNIADLWLKSIKSKGEKTSEQPEKKRHNPDRIFFQTEERLTLLRSNEFLKDFSDVRLVTILLDKLAQLESHLLMNENRVEFKIFDKLAFGRYRRLSEIAYSSLEIHDDENKKKIKGHKYMLGEYVSEPQLTLPIKIDRMTANRPNGKSTLVFRIDSELNINLKKSYVVGYPVDLNIEGGKKVFITNDLKKALKEFKKGDYEFIGAGFLNGSGDNIADHIAVKVTEKNDILSKIIPYSENSQIMKNTADEFIGRGDFGEGGKGFRYYGTFRVGYKNSEIWVEDTLRKPKTETVGATNPAGYPELTYFLIPKVCSNLVVPIQTHSYYLKKYTSYSHISEYFELEKKLLNIMREKELEYNQLSHYPEAYQNVKDILDLRIKLRYFYSLRSVEIDIIKTLRLNNPQQSPDIVPYYSGEVHLQFGNPYKYYDTKKPFGSKHSEDQQFSSLDTIISVDRGEKHFATITLSSINWDEWKNGEYSVTKQKILKPFAQTYLPILSRESLKHLINEGFITNDDYKNKHISSFTLFLKAADTAKKLGKTVNLDPKHDSVFDHHENLNKKYTNSQRIYGSAPLQMREMRENFTKLTSQHIATQLTKLAHTYNSAIIFERLHPNFQGSDKNIIKVYKQLQQLTLLKMRRIGRSSVLDIAEWEEKSSSFVLSDNRSNTLSIGFTAANYTSQFCNNCGFINLQKLQGVEQFSLDTNQFETSGDIIVWYHSHPIFRIETKRNIDTTTWKAYRKFNPMFFDNPDSWTEDTLIAHTPYFSKNFSKQTRKQSMFDVIAERFLLKDKPNDRIQDGKELKTSISEKTKQYLLEFIVKNCLKTRQSQEEFACPHCGYGHKIINSKNVNADLNASYNIGLFFVTGMWLCINDERFKSSKEGITSAIISKLSS